MKKKNLSLPIAAIVLGALIIVYIIVSAKFADFDDALDTSTDTGTATYAVNDIDENKITALSFTNDGVEYAFSLKEKIWHYDADEHFDVDETVMADIVSAVSGIRASKKLDGADTQSAEYGLDAPLHTIKVSTSDGKTYIYRIGAYNKHTRLNYLTADGDSAVYMVTSDFAALFAGELYDLLAYEEMEKITAADVKLITAEGSFGKITLSVTKDEDGNAVYTHTNAKGGEAVLEAESGAAIVRTLSSVGLSTCVDHYATEDERAQYSLDDENKIKITVKYTVSVTASDDQTSGATGPSAMVDKEYVYYIGRVNELIEEDSTDTDAVTGETIAEISESVSASATDAESSTESSSESNTEGGEDEPKYKTVTYLMLDGSYMVYKVNITAADVFFE